MSDTADLSNLDGPVPGVPGAVIREVESLPEHLAGGKEIGPCTEAMPGALLFEIPGIARYLIRDGKLIEVAPVAGADRSAVALFLHGSARATLIHQREELPLNATTLVTPTFKCVALAGPSGHGKSTLAAELCRRGWLLLADGVTRVSWNGSMAVAWPSSDSLKLWGDACIRLGIDSSGLVPVRQGIGKFYFPTKPSVSPAALATIVRLRVSPKVGIVHFPQEDSAQLISDSTCRPNQIVPLGCGTAHERIVRQIASVCRTIGLDGARAAEFGDVAEHLARALR